MITEIIEALENYYDDDIDGLSDTLFYMYHSTKDTKLQNKIYSKMTNLGKCVNCNGDLELKIYAEVHDELEGNPIEYISDIVCRDCGL